MRLCLDTNVYSAFKRGNKSVALAIENADAVFVPTIVLGELYAGFHMGGRTQRNIAELGEFMDLPGVEETLVTGAIAERYGMIVASLRKKGTPIPTNDIWIAATALETGVRLLSFDGHFEEIPGLAVITPDDE